MKKLILILMSLCLCNMALAKGDAPAVQYTPSRPSPSTAPRDAILLDVIDASVGSYYSGTQSTCLTNLLNAMQDLETDNEVLSMCSKVYYNVVEKTSGSSSGRYYTRMKVQVLCDRRTFTETVEEDLLNKCLGKARPVELVQACQDLANTLNAQQPTQFYSRPKNCK
ncbi:MAG: hypothetical protein AAF203_05445 [Pseudomonadota bacterium]